MYVLRRGLRNSDWMWCDWIWPERYPVKMRIVVIGGTGHIGTYLSPMLFETGHEVICVSRGAHQPYQPHHGWSEIRRVALDREAEPVPWLGNRRIRFSFA